MNIRKNVQSSQGAQTRYKSEESVNTAFGTLFQRRHKTTELSA